jgi:membrane-associated phospholipid phosphatase
MQFLTDFADLAVVLPLAACIAAWLALSGWRRGARLWLEAVAGMLGIMLALKLLLIGCHHGESALTSPSGHTATATLVYGAIAAIVLRPRPAALAVIGAAVAVVFGVSRVMVHAHSVPDVIVGGAVGVTALLLFVRAVGDLPPVLKPARLLLACLPIILLLHGARLTLEPHLRGAADYLGLSICRVTG